MYIFLLVLVCWLIAGACLAYLLDWELDWFEKLFWLVLGVCLGLAVKLTTLLP